MTDLELGTLPPTHQDRVRRAALNREAGGMGGWGHAHNAGARAKRIGESLLSPSLLLSLTDRY